MGTNNSNSRSNTHTTASYSNTSYSTEISESTISKEVLLLNKDFLEGVFKPSIKGAKVSELHRHLAKVFTIYDHPLFPKEWLDKLIIVIYDSELMRCISPLLNSLWGKTPIIIGIENKITGMVEPYRYLGNKGYISGYKLEKGVIPSIGSPISTNELLEERALGNLQIWDAASINHEIIDNLYTLWLKLGTVEERRKFLFRVLEGVKSNKLSVVLDSKGTINITGVSLKDYPNNQLKIRLLEDGSGELQGISTRSTNAKVWLGKSYNSKHECVVEGAFILSILLMNEMKYFSSNSIEIKCLNLTSLWKAPDNYGGTPLSNSTDAAIKCSIIKPITPLLVNPESSFPGIAYRSASDNNGNSPEGDVSSSALLEYLLLKGIPAVPHKYVMYLKYVIAGVGAEAMGVGLRVNPQYKKENPSAIPGNTPLEYLEILTSNSDDKVTKAFNRATGNHKAVTAEGTTKHPLVKSHLIMGTSKGDVFFYGIETNVVLTNSSLGNGSGVASLNPEKEPFSFSIEKRLTGQIPSWLIPKKELDKLMRVGVGNTPLAKLLPFIKAKLEKIIKEGKVYGPNKTILTIWDNDPDYKTTVVVTPSANLHYKLKPLDDDSLLIVESPSSTGNILISLKAECIVEGDTQCKLRAPGIKCTTISEAIYFEDNRDWTLFLPYEAIKGRLMQIYIFANWLYNDQGVDTRYISNEGLLLFDKPIKYKGSTYTSADLTTTDNIFEEWIKDNTSLVWVRRRVARHIINVIQEEEPHLLQSIGEDKPEADLQLLEEIKDDNGQVIGYLVRELLQTLSGTAHVKIEVTTPREYITSEAFTLERLAVLECISAELALAINKSAESLHDGIRTLISYCEGTLDVSDVSEYTLIELKDYLETYIKEEEIHLDKSSDILEVCEHLFPKGLILRDMSEEKVYLHFGLILKYAAISSSGTVSNGLAGNLIDLLRRLLAEDITPERLQMYSLICRAIQLDVNQWASNMQGLRKGQSKVLANLGKTANICTGVKVKTIQSPEVEHRRGLPVFIFHPDCESIRRLRLTDGDFIAVGRNPLSSVCFGIAVIDDSIGHISHILCSPQVWAAGTQGDSDGDSTTTLNLSRLLIDRLYNQERGRWENKYFETTEEELKVWNDSLLMMGGVDESFKGFISGKSKWTTKLIDVTKPHPLFLSKELTPITSVIPALKYIGLGKKVAEHYRYNVGNGYSIYSVLCFWVTNAICGLRKDILNQWVDYDPSDIEHITKLNQLIKKETYHLQQALSTSCRFIYEELGLGGYKASSAEVFDVINALVDSDQYKGKIGLVYDDTYPNGKRYVRVSELPKYMEDYTYEEVEGRELLSILLFNNKDSTSLSIVDVIIAANQLRLTFGSIENRPRTIIFHPSQLTKEEIACIYGALRRLGKGDFSRGLQGASTFEIVNSILGSSLLNNFIQSDILLYYLGNIPTIYKVFTRYVETNRLPF